jgi:arylformamidase
VDAPLHFIRGAIGVDNLPLDALIGPARVITIRDPHSVTAEELARHDLQKAERVLLKTANSPRSWEQPGFARDYVGLSPSGARHLVERGVRTVGIDYLSVGGLDNGAEIHHMLLGAGVCIIEGLNLTAAPEGPCELLCLPLRIQDGDGAPARVVLLYSQAARETRRAAEA